MRIAFLLWTMVPVSLAAVDIEIVSDLPYNFSVVSALIWTEAAFDLAIEAANKKYAPFLSISLQLIFRPSDSNCDDLRSNVVRDLSEFYYKKTNNQTLYALVSSICTDEAGTQSIATGWDWPLFTNALALGDFPYNNMTVPALAIGSTGHGYAMVLIKILMSFAWAHVTVLQQKGAFSPYYPTVAKSLVPLLNERRGNFSFVADTYLFTTDRRSMSDGLRYAKARSRAIVILAPGKIALALLRLANDAGLTSGEFVFLNVQPMQQGVFGTAGDSFGDISLFNHPETINLSAFRSFIFIACRSSGADQQDLNNRLLAKSRALDAQAKPGYTKDIQPLDSFAVQATFDLVDVLAQTVNETAPFLPDPAVWSGRELVDLMANRTYAGLTTGDVYINSKKERLLDMDIFAFSAQTSSLQRFGRFLGSSGSLSWTREAIDWPTSDGKPPLDVPVCGFSGLTGACQPAESLPLWRIIVPVSLGAFVTTAAALYAGHVCRSERNFHWLLDQRDLIPRAKYNERSFLPCTQSNGIFS